MHRTIFHVDMDAFYAAVEQRDYPRYRERPVIVGADPKEGRGRGVVAACSYEARKLGIRSALPISRAFSLCPEGVYLRPNMQRYMQVSKAIRDIFRTYTDLVEPLSIDEAFLDLSHTSHTNASALEMARSLKDSILKDQGLTASIGIAPNKFVAKIASDIDKPDGLVLVSSSEVQSFLDPLSITHLWGVGPKTESKLVEMGIRTILQLRHYDKIVLIRRFGKLGKHLWELSNGIDERMVMAKREARSLGHEKTFLEDIGDRVVLEKALMLLCVKVSERLRARRLSCKTITLKLRYSNFTTITRQMTCSHSVQTVDDIYFSAQKIFRKHCESSRKIRLIGVSVSSFKPRIRSGAEQIKLF